METNTVIETLVEERDSIFFEAFKDLEEKRKKAVYAVYAYYQTAQDAIEKDGDLEKLQTIKKNIKDTFDGQVPKEPLYEALYEAIMAYPTTITPYMELLDALRDDHYDKPIETEKDLDDYLTKAGGSLGLMLAPILAHKSYKDNLKKVKTMGQAMGQAFELTQILRNVRDDLIDHRIYFSKETIEHHKVRITTLRTGMVTSEYRSMMEFYIEKAKALYESFQKLSEHLDEETKYHTMLLMQMYEGLLDEIRKGGYANITKRYRLSKLRMFFLKRKLKSRLK